MNRTKGFILLNLIGLLVIAMLTLPIADIFGQGGVTVFSNLRITNFYRAQPRTALVVTNGGTINATGTLQRLTSAAAVGTAGTAITIKPSGTLLTLVNVGANTIVITETGVFTSAGNITLGPGDATTLYSNGAAWTQLSFNNN